MAENFDTGFENLREEKTKISKAACCSLILAVAGIFAFFITAPISILLGIIGILKIQKSKGRLKGASLAIAAIIISVSGIFWMYHTGLPRMRSIAPRMVCGTNLSKLGKAMLIYANNNDGKYPDPDKWCDLIAEEYDLVDENFKCPDNKINRCSYAMNPDCEPNSPADTVLLFETYCRWDGNDWNQSGGIAILSCDNHEQQGCNVLFNDSHAAFIKAKETKNLRWK